MPALSEHPGVGPFRELRDRLLSHVPDRGADAEGPPAVEAVEVDRVDRVHAVLRRLQIAKDKALALNDLAGVAGNRLGEDRAGMDEGVELAVLPAGVNARGQIGEQLLVIGTPREGGVERLRVQADDVRLEAGGDELASQDAGVASPQREETAPAVCGESLLAVCADIFEIEIAEGDGLVVELGRRG